MYLRAVTPLAAAIALCLSPLTGQAAEIQPAELLAQRGLMPVPGGYTWRTDPRLTLPSPMRLTRAHALAFASALWVTDRKLSAVRGPVRSMLTMLVVFIAASLAGAVELLPGGLTLPREPAGWYGLAALVVLYGTGFTTLFVSMPRLDMPANAPALNVEPLATLLLGWLLLGQALEPIQLVGGLIVVCAIVLLTYRRG
ncbi:MAG: EamA family transporter [Betaproteobacteria bacterium]|nr:EamA family transporter [Betaproteobacteria bacterium]